jgi:hypothetical protein
VFSHRLAATGVGDDEGFHDRRAQAAESFNADGIGWFYRCHQFITHVRRKVDLHAIAQQQSIHVAVWIYQISFN